MRVAGNTRCTGCALSRAATTSVPKGSVGRVVSRSRSDFCGSRAFSWRRPLLQRGLKRGHCIRGVRVFGAAAPAQERSVDAVKEAHGFTLVRQEFIKEYNSDVLVYNHEKSGAQLISVVNDDENKTFSANFRTPVNNACGVPHILEHSVLGGSRKYPVKEPFVELIKGSLNTFLNAMTYPDRTLYPVASCNLQDFYNLVDVYLDAVLHPSCLENPMIFQQEGWHYELESPEDTISYKGVVFNEMKGEYSSPDSENYRVTMQSIFSANNYKDDSGGNPQAIPKLTFEEFKNYHASYYHPSNSVFWFSGDDSPVERLRILDEYLSEFDKKVVKSEVDRQPLLTEPQKIEDRYAAGEEDDRCFASINWMLSAEPFDTEEEIAMEFLDYLLLGTQAAPLYKVLTDSGLGESVIGFGMEDNFVQPFFGVGLKGVKAEDVEKVEKVVLEELERLSQEGFSSSAVEAAMNTIEFSLRENNTGSFPRGISLLTRVMSRWTYDKDALEGIKWEAPLSRFKERVAAGEDIFKPLIKKYMLENPHRVAFTMLPDPKKSELLEEKEQKALEDYQKSLSKEEIAEIVETTAALKKRQSTPDSPEALKSIPSLQLSDIPKKIPTIPTAEEKKGETTYLAHDLFTNNILYLDVVLELRTVPVRLLPLVPLFCESLTQMGTEKEDFVQLTERIGRKVGALSVSPFVTSKEGSKDPVAKLFIQGKATKDKGADLVELMHDILTYTCFDNPERFKQLVLETKAGMEAGMGSSGNSYAAMRLSAKFSTAGYVNELMGGYSYLVFIRNLVDRIENDWDSVRNDLEELREILMNSQGSIVNMTGDEDTLSVSRPHIEGFLEGMPSMDAPIPTWSSLLPGSNEALVLPTQVNYIGKAVNLYSASDYKYEGSAAVVQRNITLGHLWEKVRAMGGAYGCSASLDSHSGILSFVSYRDPNILDTLKNYDAAGEYLKNIEMDESSIVKDIIGTMSSVDRHQLPDAKGRTALTRKLLGITEELRQLRRDQILSTSVEDYRRLGDYIEYMKTDDAKIVAVTSQPKANDVLKENPDFWDIEVVQ